VLTRFAFYAQDYKSRKPVTVNGFVCEQYNYPYRRKCECYVVIAVRYFGDKVQLFVSGEHTKDCHADVLLRQRSEFDCGKKSYH
jgi:hypothetical protein